MYKILINDGIHPKGAQMLIDAGFKVDNFNIPQENLMEKLPSYDVICVRSATTVRADLIKSCPKLKIIGRFKYNSQSKIGFVFLVSVSSFE